MRLFKSIFKAISPKILIKRQRELILGLVSLSPNFKVIVISDEEVLLKQPESDEEEEVLLTLKQSYNSVDPIQCKTLYITYKTTIEGKPININLNFNDSTASYIIINQIGEALKTELQKVMIEIKEAKIKENDKIDNCISTTQSSTNIIQETIFAACLARLASNSSDEDALYGKLFDVFDGLISNLKESLKDPFIREELYNKYLYNNTNKKYTTIFINYCCSSYHFLFNNDIIEEFEHILLTWGYEDSYIKHIVAEAIHTDIPINPFPLTLSEQQTITELYTKKCIQMGYIPTTKGFFNTSNKRVNHAFFGIIVSLSNPGWDKMHYENQYREEALEILANYAIELKLNQSDIKKIFISQTYSDQESYINIVRQVKNTESLIRFINACYKLSYISFFNGHEVLSKLLRKIGFNDDLIYSVIGGKTISKTSVTINSQTHTEPQRVNYNRKEKNLSDFLFRGCYGYEITLLSKEQRLSFLTVFIHFSKLPLFNNIKETEEEVEGFCKKLKVNNGYLEKNKQSELLDINHAFEIVKSTKKDDPFFALFMACDSLLFLANSDFQHSLEFNNLLKNIGFTQTEINNINNNKLFFRYSDYRLRNNSTIKCTETIDKNSIQESDMEKDITIFIEDWKLMDFYRQHGKMQVGSFVEEPYNIAYRACTFTNLNGVKTYVYFFSELGELSPKEIVARKNELYIGKAENGNYFLYSKKNKGWKLIDKSTESIELNTRNEELEDIENSSYRDSNYGIDTLSMVQKCSLGVASYLGIIPALKDKKLEVAKVLADYREQLGLSNEDLETINFKQFIINKPHCFETVKTIKKDGPFIIFLDVCTWLLDIINNDIFHSQELKIILKDMGFTQEEIDSICHNKFIFRYDGKL